MSTNLRPLVGVGVIVTRGDKILIGERVGNHGAGTFMIPGGHVEFGETFEAAAAREVAEETGLKNLTIKGLISVYNAVDYDKHYVSVGILAESKEGEPETLEPDKARNWSWYNPTALPENIFKPSRRTIDNWRRGQIYTD